MRLTRLNQLIKSREIIDGTWRVGPHSRLQYRRRGKQEEVLFSGEWVSAEADALVFQAEERSEEGTAVNRLLSLKGRWQADDKNRLSFLVQRESGRADRLIFEGGWEVGPEHELLYRREEEKTGAKTSRANLLRFQGYWDLTEDKRLTYVLDRDSNSLFRFRSAFQTPSVLAKEGAIRYQVGVEVGGKNRFQTITFFGKWKLSRDLSLEFEIPYGNGKVRSMAFGAAYAVNAKMEIAAKLKTVGGKPLGLEVIFSREFLKGSGETFIRLRRSLEEAAVEAGARFRW